MTFVFQLMPSLSINNNYRIFVLHQLIVVPHTVVGTVIVVHYFLAGSAIPFLARSWSGLCQSNIILAESIKYYMTSDFQIIPSSSLNEDWIRRTGYFSPRSCSGFSQSKTII